MDTSCPLSEAVFLFLNPTERSHDQSPPWRLVRIPAAVFAWPAGHVRACVCVCVRKVRGKGRPVGHHKAKSYNNSIELWLQQHVLYPVVSTCSSTLTMFSEEKSVSFSNFEALKCLVYVSVFVCACVSLSRIAHNISLDSSIKDCMSLESVFFKYLNKITTNRLIILNIIVTLYFNFLFCYIYTHVTCIHLGEKNRTFLCFKYSCKCMKFMKVEKMNSVVI